MKFKEHDENAKEHKVNYDCYSSDDEIHSDWVCPVGDWDYLSNE